MAAYLEVRTPSGTQVIALSSERASVGVSPANDVSLAFDPTVSRLHAVFERFPSGWSVRDLGSHNGTFVNGQRVWNEQALRSGDEVRVGGTRMLFRSEEPELTSPTASDATSRVPNVTRREREVLIALCEPLLEGDAFTEPASIRRIAASLSVTEGAVKQHFVRLYDKFGVHGQGERRRFRLANEAIRRGVVTLADLREANADTPTT